MKSELESAPRPAGDADKQLILPAVKPAAKVDPKRKTKLGTPVKLTKRKWSDDEKRALVMRFATRGNTESVADFCLKHDINETLIRRWSADPKFRYRPDKLVKRTPAAKSPAPKAAEQKIPEKVGRNYPIEFKKQVVAAYLNRESSGETAAHVIKRFGVHPSAFYTWLKDPRLAAPDAHETIAEFEGAARTERAAKREAKQSDELAKLRLQVQVLQGMVALAVRQGFEPLDISLLGGKS